MKLNFKKLGLAAMASSALLLAACSPPDAGSSSESENQIVDGNEITLSYVPWDTEIASTNVIATVLGDLGYDVTSTSLDNAIMWESVATGEADASVAAWVPNTHAAQIEEYGDQVVDLGPNLEGAQLGITVPAYMEDVNSIADLTDEASQTITGIEAGAGVVAAAEQAVEDYDNLSDWNVQTSSSGAMTTELGNAIANEEEIVVTGWTPHWMYQEYDLKILEDPEGSMGQAETINSFARPGLEEDDPIAYSVLDNFYWEQADMESIMQEIQAGTPAEDAARTWVDENQDKVSEWTAEAEEMAASQSE